MKMRRFISVLMLVVIVLAQAALFNGCGKDTKPTGGTDAGTTDAGAKDETASVSKYKLKSDGVYTLALMSDTQHYADRNPQVFFDMTKFLADNKEKYTIEYVIHAGDLVQHATDDAEWKVAREAMSALDGIIPYGVLAGNHDQANGTERFTAYASYFGDSSYKPFDYFGESYHDCRAMYQLIKIGSTEFVVVFIGDDPDIGCIDFANAVFEKYRDRVGILCTHNYLEEDLTRNDMGEYMCEKIVAENENVYMVLCGHESAAGILTSDFDDDGDGKTDRTVCQIIANYQDANCDGSMMFLQIDENAGTLTGISYSPVLDTYAGYKDKTDDAFQVPIPWLSIGVK